MASLRARAVVRLAEVLRCRNELLEVVSGGSLRFVKTSRAVLDAHLASTGLRYSDLTAEHPLYGLHLDEPAPSRLKQILHNACAFVFPPSAGGTLP